MGGEAGGNHLVMREEEEFLAARQQLKRVLGGGLRLGSAQLDAHLRGGCGLGCGVAAGACGGAEMRRCRVAEVCAEVHTCESSRCCSKPESTPPAAAACRA